jgi:superoxide reductase
MAEQNGIYKCSVCGNVVSVLEAHAGELVCCGKEMELLKEKTAEEEGKEKHVPIIEKTEGGVKVKVGSVPHPMEEKHFISLIQLIDTKGNVVIGKRLKPGDKPEAEFCCLASADGLRARIYCNIHGLWTN